MPNNIQTRVQAQHQRCKSQRHLAQQAITNQRIYSFLNTGQTPNGLKRITVDSTVTTAMSTVLTTTINSNMLGNTSLSMNMQTTVTKKKHYKSKDNFHDFSLNSI